MKFILGTKQYQTELFHDDGTVTPATVLSAGPLVVTQVKKNETDGYAAVQVGFIPAKSSRITRAQQGHVKKSGGMFRVLREFRVPEDVANTFTVGSTIDVSAFEKGDKVAVSGTTKGKGFQGAVKRHGFSGGPRSHGQKHSEREVGSIGAGGMQRVIKGMRMPGRMGNNRVTVKNLKVLEKDASKQLLVISGAVPGRRGALIEVRSI